jgi:EAL domain-containing protein (putative c-di-GMP-specific phosphodiesterase class I)
LILQRPVGELSHSKRRRVAHRIATSHAPTGLSNRERFSTELVGRIAARRRLSTIGSLRRALDANQIVVDFQPIVSIHDRRVSGAEGLVRWQHPQLGLLAPAAFIHMVERTGLIASLTRHVLERSIAECAAWRRGGSEMSVAVNLSARNLLDRSLAREVGCLIDDYGLRPDALQLEITESMIMSDPDRALATVGALKELGVRVSIDDFGTGYSSLSNVKRLPIDELKIDRSFVSAMSHDDNDMIIVRSTINLGHDLGLDVVAEGVEDEDTLQHLGRLQCDLAQGYHIGRPMPAVAFREWIAEQPARGRGESEPARC